jgi:hypothetical protein
LHQPHQAVTSLAHQLQSLFNLLLYNNFSTTSHFRFYSVQYGDSYTLTSATMDKVQHISVPSKVLLKKARKIVPPMLEKFHKGKRSSVQEVILSSH